MGMGMRMGMGMGMGMGMCVFLYWRLKSWEGSLKRGAFEWNETRYIFLMSPCRLGKEWKNR